MAKKKKEEIASHNNHNENELLENSEALASKVEGSVVFIEKNKSSLYALAAVGLLLAAGIFGYGYFNKVQNAKAEEDIFQSIYYFEAGDFKKALKGDENYPGFIEIIDNYGTTKSANLAQYYAGVSYLKEGDFDKAIEHLDKFSSDDLILQSRAYAVTGDAYSEKNDYKKAAEFYEKAANHNANKFFSPSYLTKAALALETVGDINSAKAAYKTILQKYKDSSEYSDAKKQLARLNAIK